ncbi:MAG: hypothetical protein EXR71_14295 [Myxococcales bacterium]|nr:hypothetical protein [Myxococcales bacterium]
MFLFFVLSACTTADETGETGDPADTGPFDADGDGIYTPEDCDDSRDDVYPGAADDQKGDGVDMDCVGGDGDPIVGCSPILVPDVYPTIEDALLDGKSNLCLGPGTYAPGPLPDGATAVSAFRGQGRDVTVVDDPSGHYEVRVLAGLTATGRVTGSGSYQFNDVTLRDAVIADFDNFFCDRCGLVRSPIDAEVSEAVAGIALSDGWIAGATAGVRLTLSGCRNSCSGYYTDLRMYNMTFVGNAVAIELDLSGDYDIYSVIDNSVFVDNGAIMTVAEGSGVVPRLNISSQGNVEWGSTDAFPDGDDFSIKVQDPQLDMAFTPPRPMEGSPLIDSAKGDFVTFTDFWGVERIDADKGAVEYLAPSP